jgi:hypothetical protein
MTLTLCAGRQMGILAFALACSASAIGMDDLGHTGKSNLSTATPNGDVKVRIQAEPAGEFSESSKGSRISSVEINVGGVNIRVPRSAYADLIDPRQAKVEFKGAAGAVSIDGGDGAEAYLVRIFFDGKRVYRRTLSSALMPSKPAEETRYLLLVMKDE